MWLILRVQGKSLLFLKPWLDKHCNKTCIIQILSNIRSVMVTDGWQIIEPKPTIGTHVNPTFLFFSTHDLNRPVWMSSIFTSFRSGHGILLPPIQKYLNYTLKSGEYLKLTIPCISLEPDNDHQLPPCYIHLDMTYFEMVLNNGSIT